jgi:hypothetical protein
MTLTTHPLAWAALPIVADIGGGYANPPIRRWGHGERWGAMGAWGHGGMGGGYANPPGQRWMSLGGDEARRVAAVSDA